MTDNPDAVFEQAGEDIRRVVICNAKGLHARASAKFVQLAEQFDAEIAVRRDGAAVGGTSIMGLLMLAASQGCEIELAAQGPGSRNGAEPALRTGGGRLRRECLGGARPRTGELRAPRPETAHGGFTGPRAARSRA